MQHVDALLLSAKALAARPSHCAGLLARLMALDIRSRVNVGSMNVYTARHGRSFPCNKVSCLRLTSDLREWVLRTADDACKGWMIS